MSQIFIQFKDDVYEPEVYLRFQYDLERVLIVAGDKREIIREAGHDVTHTYLSRTADELAKLPLSDASQDEIEKKAVELLVFSCAELMEFKDLPAEQLAGATIECALDNKSKGLVVNLANPANPLHQKLMCASMHVEAFADEYHQLQRSTNFYLDEKASIIDQTIDTYGELINTLSRIKNFNPLVSSFILNVKQDIAPAISLTMGGRGDAGYALARRAIEIVGFARTIIEDKEAENLWQDAHENPAMGKEYRNRFALSKILPKGHPFWDHLYRRYDGFSKFHHPTPLSFSRMSWQPTDDGKLEINVRQTQHSEEDAEKNVDEVWMVLETYTMCLCGFEYAIRDHADVGDLRNSIENLIQEVGNITKIKSSGDF